ncbi:putative glucose-6-phosphate 1-epimerase isoform X1 [Cannabis sativa]|uniref:putative glucose-6-phosphate 1-epimerase isoform X1 n=1 Tax=Cannabis sativa TaxID=3483 RepID=UPI0029CA71ED|nr:putative glucose-6-phosphate 1-epimerase isoform X1 [Cannabis sativa]
MHGSSGGGSGNSSSSSSPRTYSVDLVKDRNGIEQVLLKNHRGASVRVSLHGGQVRSWMNERGHEMLFTSSKAIFKPPKPVRGGIPICFPQFGSSGTLEQHGFVRNKIWSIDNDPPPLPPKDSIGKTFIDLVFKPTADDMKIWPHRFEIRLRVCLGSEGNLILIPRVRNLDTKPFSFSFAFHTYFAISDINEIRIEGLETLYYLDNLKERECFTEQYTAITFESEVDRIYVRAENVVAILDHERKKSFIIRREGLPDVVVWNPWATKAKAIADFGDDEYKRMVCVDGAAVERPITLKPCQEWTGRLELTRVNSCLDDLSLLR